MGICIGLSLGRQHRDEGFDQALDHKGSADELSRSVSVSLGEQSSLDLLLIEQISALLACWRRLWLEQASEGRFCSLLSLLLFEAVHGCADFAFCSRSSN